MTFSGGSGVPRAAVVAGGQHVRRARVDVPGVGEEDVEEAGAGDLDAVDAARRAARCSSPPSRSAISRGGAPSAGASSIAAFVE